MRLKRVKKKRQKLDKPKKGMGEKNYFLAFILAILSWAGVMATVLWSVPGTITIFVFFIILSIALLITLSILFANTQRGLLVTAVIIVFLLLRLVKLGNLLNLSLLVGAAISFELYRKH